MRGRLGWFVGVLGIGAALMLIAGTAVYLDNSRRVVSEASDPSRSTFARPAAQKQFERVSPSRGRVKPVVAFVGDSFVSGKPVDGGDSGEELVEEIADTASWTLMYRASPAVGYAHGTLGESPSIVDLLDESTLSSLSPDLVIIHAGWNDRERLERETVVGVQNSIEFVRAKAPGIPIVVVGPLWGRGTMPTELLRVYRSVAGVALHAAGVHFVTTYDLSFRSHPVSGRPVGEGRDEVAQWIVRSMSNVGLV
ncbi:SGNH/GDSL hydrolase family protein [Gordonia ajococcus]|uniref:SGNH/GDSL hydrolase family protein n=1 Tax=Gordonia ajococcus TaxID=1292359 RepID=UPI00177C7E60|nr:SGNH/GDSL hydrolase family protein [Gordonia ajococcus]